MKYPIFIILLVLISSCGGGGGGSAPAVVNQPNTAAPVDPLAYQAGIFSASSQYKQYCESPRSGIDPITGLVNIDVQGSIVHENHWLRSWSNELYLWYDEIPDLNPTVITDPIEYFEMLKSPLLTPNGTPKDSFHFTYDTNEWNLLSQSGVSADYGARFAVTAYYDSTSLQIAIAYVEPNSPAAEQGLTRGMEVISVDGTATNQEMTEQQRQDVLEALFPATIDESHVFQVLGLGGSAEVIELRSENVVSSPVLKTEVLPTDTGNVGYLVFNRHIATAEAGLANAISQLQAANISDLVLDMRYNGGGLLGISSQLAYMIAGSTKTSGRTFELQTFNDKHSIIDPVTNQVIQPLPFLSTTQGFSLASGQALPTLDLSRVYILTGSETCSASESVINGLRGINIEVIQIGTTTCGKPYGFYPEDNCGTTYFSIQFSGVNDLGFGDYVNGFSPQNSIGSVGELITGCSVEESILTATGPIILGDPQEKVLAAALQYRDSNTCPIPAGSSLSSNIISATSKTELTQNIPHVQAQNIFKQNKIIGFH